MSDLVEDMEQSADRLFARLDSIRQAKAGAPEGERRDADASLRRVGNLGHALRQAAAIDCVVGLRGADLSAERPVEFRFDRVSVLLRARLHRQNQCESSRDAGDSRP